MLSMKQMKEFLINNAEWVAVIGGIIALVGTILVNVKSRRDSDATEKK